MVRRAVAVAIELRIALLGPNSTALPPCASAQRWRHTLFVARQPRKLSGPICGAAFFCASAVAAVEVLCVSALFFTRQPRQPSFSKENFLSFKVFF